MTDQDLNPGEHNPERGCLIWTLVAAALLVAGYIAIPYMLRPPHGGWENRAKLTLRALGASQGAFYGQHNRYGTWREMVATDLIQTGYNRDNMIDNYSISVFNVGYQGTGSFTIVVVPNDLRDKSKREFSITDDQRVRSRTFEDRDNGVPPWRWEPLR